MSRLTHVAAACVVLFGACDSGTYIRITIDANPMIENIDHLTFQVENGASKTGITSVPFPIRPAQLPPTRTMVLQFDDKHQGDTTIHLAAYDVDNHLLASGDGNADLKPHALVEATVVLGASRQIDGGPQDGE